MYRIGIGYDVHKLVEGRKCIIGGIEIPYEKGLLGHSDADVLLHAIMDAILGALALGDIGKHFPDNDGTYKNIDSKVLLAKVYELIRAEGYEISNIDSTVICEQPKLKDHIDQMRAVIAETLQTDIKNISVKATTTEKLGFEGRGEGISAEAVVMLMSGVREK
ncbi:MAG: 2-C-methyl-D-erythritol 2,4-cyclodiphosphate synthase [Candidatus Delongbacteria bacterium]|nr:2-C-methyl-D-erythritol 2,4-cyclodiphosphate synthase [Candidatus Delongbacteria bacterium]MCG2760020.1 2-C-methyl-D-erythritol 2,4-cyclodiphosphate synthase [Candidatus Delongbacteria bacterium]